MRWATMFVLAMGCPGCLWSPCESDGLCFAATPVALRPVDLGLKTADIDRDGHLDLVSAGGLGVALRRGSGDGSLSAPVVWTLPAQATGLALGDLDGDGAQDLVTTLPSHQSVAWLHGVVGGWDTAVLELRLGAEVQVLLAADMNGDGADEIVASERDRGRLHLWMGAAGGPSTSRYVDIGGEAVALAAADFGGDGGFEVAAVIPSLGAIALYGFSPTIGLERIGVAWTTTLPASVVAADLDQDGHDDLAAIDTIERTLWVGLGDGAGGWHREHAWPLAEAPQHIFARRRPAGHELGIISGDGRGVTLVDPFSGVARIEAIAAGELTAVVAGDFTADGSEELVYLDRTVALTQELAGFRGQSRWTVPTSALTGRVAIVDLDGDGTPELVAEDRSEPALVVFAAAGTDHVEIARHPLSGTLAGLRPLARNDGAADIAWWETGLATPSRFGVLTYSPGAGLAEMSMRTLDEPILDIVAADMNADGWADLAVTVEDGDLQALLFVKREPEGALAIGPRLLEGERISSVIASQIDGIGGDDLWVIGGGNVRALLGGVDAPMVIPSGPWSAYRARFLAADLDGDTQADLVGCNEDGVAVAYAHSDGTVAPPVTISPDACARLSACDLDADGDLDLMVGRDLFDARRNAVEVLRADADGWQQTGAFADAPDLEHTVTACRGSQLLQLSSSLRGATLREVVAGPGLREAKLPGQYALSVLAADLNGDGFDDLFTHDVLTLSLALADGEGGHTRMQNIAMPLLPGHYVQELLTVELDGRPGKELLARVKQTGIDGTSWVVMALQGAQLVARGPLASDFAARGDFDGDGRDELVLGGSAPQLLWLGADGTSITRTLALDPELFIEREEFRAVDFDGDGRDDLMTVHGRFGGAVEVLRSSSGGFEAPRPWQLEGQVDWIGVGDLDGDAAMDLVLFEQDTLVFAYGDGKGGMREASRRPDPTRESRYGTPLVDDLDGDGRAEVVVIVGSPDQSAAFQVIRPDGRGPSIPPWPIEAPATGSTVVRVHLAPGEPAWAVTGQQGALIVTMGAGSP